jgi:hypothetical protein
MALAGEFNKPEPCRFLDRTNVTAAAGRIGGVGGAN